MFQENTPELLMIVLSLGLSSHEFYPPNPSSQSWMYGKCDHCTWYTLYNISYSDTAEK